MREKIYIGIIIIGIITSCGKESIDFPVFKAGDSTGVEVFHTTPIPSPSIYPVVKSEKDTVFYDSLFLDVNGDLNNDFTFILQQRFDTMNPELPSQKITIKTGSGIFLQLIPGILPSFAYVKTISVGDTVDSHIPWVADSVFFLTYIKNNFVEAPRYEQPYLPFKFINGDLGWLRMGFENDFLNGIVQRFYVNEYCLKREGY